MVQMMVDKIMNRCAFQERRLIPLGKSTRSSDDHQSLIHLLRRAGNNQRRGILPRLSHVAQCNSTEATKIASPVGDREAFL